MVKNLPCYNLLAEVLEWEESAVWCETSDSHWKPTIVNLLRFLVEEILETLTAT